MFVSAELEARLRPIVEKLDREQIADLVDLLVLVAHADGVIDRDEREALQAGVETVVGSRLIRSVVNVLVDESIEKIASEGVSTRAMSVADSLAFSGHTEAGLRAGIAVALASAGVSDHERAVLLTIARAGGVPAIRLDELIAEEQAALTAEG